MENEKPQNAHGHYEFVTFVLPVIDKNIQNFVALIEYNEYTSRAFGHLVGSNFIGCHRNRLSLSVKEILPI